MAEPAPRFLTAEWRDLVMLSWAIDPAALAARVPAGCELDLSPGRCFVSVVGFRFLRTRVLGVRIPFHTDFDEVNLRFYVRRKGEDGWRRGVVFVKEIVPRRAVAALARAVYGEPYVAHPMRHAIRREADGATALRYEWRRRDAWEGMTARHDGRAAAADPGSEEEFIVEHAWGYTRTRRGSTLEYRVEHPPWRIGRGAEASLACDAASLYGPEFADALAAPPVSAFVADGSQVLVRRGQNI
jgi:uncharacterized protein YqjF (DUF2071 family)